MFCLLDRIEAKNKHPLSFFSLLHCAEQNTIFPVEPYPFLWQTPYIASGSLNFEQTASTASTARIQRRTKQPIYWQTIALLKPTFAGAIDSRTAVGRRRARRATSAAFQQNKL